MTKDERPESQPVDISSSFNRCHYVAHELANPLGGMLMSVDVIEKYFDANPRAREEIGDLPTILKREIIRLISLVKQLRFSEIPRDDKLQQTSLAVQVREILALQSAYYERRGIRIEQEIGLDLPRMLGDPQ